MESTPQEKTEYELARDRRVIEVQKRMAPVVAALQDWEASKAKPRQVRFSEKPTSNEAQPVRRSGRRLYLGGQEASKATGREQIGKRGEETGTMSSARTTSLEATNTNDEDIATSMMHLAIACTHVDRQSKRFIRATVFLMNPRAIRHKAAIGKISGMPGKHKFHFQDIPENWLKVDVHEILIPRVKLMFPGRDDKQDKIEDVKETATLLDQKYLKAVA